MVEAAARRDALQGLGRLCGAASAHGAQDLVTSATEHLLRCGLVAEDLRTQKVGVGRCPAVLSPSLAQALAACAREAGKGRFGGCRGHGQHARVDGSARERGGVHHGRSGGRVLRVPADRAVHVPERSGEGSGRALWRRATPADAQPAVQQEPAGEHPGRGIAWLLGSEGAGAQEGCAGLAAQRHHFLQVTCGLWLLAT